MAVTGSEALVTQRFRKSAIDATTITLVPSLLLVEARPNHLRATQVVITYAATSENFYGAIAGSLGLSDKVEYEISVRRVG